MNERYKLLGGGTVDYQPDWLNEKTATAFFERMVEKLPLQEKTVTVFGKRRVQPRLTSWHADEGCTYRYSGLTLEPEPWNEELSAMRTLLQQECRVPFNSVLANFYRGGEDSMGWHADNER